MESQSLLRLIQERVPNIDLRQWASLSRDSGSTTCPDRDGRGARRCALDSYERRSERWRMSGAKRPAAISRFWRFSSRLDEVFAGLAVLIFPWGPRNGPSPAGGFSASWQN